MTPNYLQNIKPMGGQPLQGIQPMGQNNQNYSTVQAPASSYAPPMNNFTKPATPAIKTTAPSLAQSNPQQVAASSNTPSNAQLKQIQDLLAFRKANNIPETTTTSNYFSGQTPTSTSTTTLPAQNQTLNNMANQGTLYSQLVQNLANYKTPENLEKAYNTATNLEAGLQAGQNAIMAKPIPLEFQQGQAAALQRDYGPQLIAAKGILEKELAGAQLGQKALETAISAAAPIQVAPGTTAVSPLTGEAVAGGIGGYANYQTAQQVFNTASQYKDAVNSIGQPFTYDQTKTPQENWQTFSTQYLPNSRTYQMALNAGGMTSNIGQGGAANPLVQSTVNQTNQAGYTQAYKDYQDLNAKYQTAASLGNMLVDTLQQGGLNTSNLNVLNQTVNSLKGQVSDTALAKFNSTLHSARSAYTDILTSGGGTIPTTASKALDDIINPNSSIAAIQAAISQLNNEVVTARLVPAMNKSNQYLQGLQGAGTSGATTGATNQPTSSGGGSQYNW